VFTQLNGLLRELVRQKEGRNASPSACVIDAQSVKTSTSGPASSQGTDAGKKIVGRKRSIVTDTIGLLLAVLVTAASVQDTVAGTQLLDQVAAAHPTIRKVWVDGGYRKHFIEHAATLGIDLEVTARAPGTRGFTPETGGGRADLLLAHAPPPPGPRLRNPARPLRSRDPPGDDRPHGPPPHRRSHHLTA
jgi:transposase